MGGLVRRARQAGWTGPGQVTAGGHRVLLGDMRRRHWILSEKKELLDTKLA